MTEKKLFSILLITISVFIVAVTGHAEDRKPLAAVHAGVTASPGFPGPVRQ